MAIHRLSIDEFDEVNYELIAIHTSLEDYRLAYFVNQKLPVLLTKNKTEIQANSKEGEAYFSRFTYSVPESDTTWTLVQNKNEVLLAKKDASNLFAGEVTARVYLLPEFKRVDYFLKIENPGETTPDIVKELNAINRVSTVYTVDAEKIKSKNNLIF